jgi:hypothetical protein
MLMLGSAGLRAAARWAKPGGGLNPVPAPPSLARIYAASAKPVNVTKAWLALSCGIRTYGGEKLRLQAAFVSQLHHALLHFLDFSNRGSMRIILHGCYFEIYFTITIRKSTLPPRQKTVFLGKFGLHGKTVTKKIHPLPSPGINIENGTYKQWRLPSSVSHLTSFFYGTTGC